MKTDTKKLTLGAMLTVLTLILLYSTTILTTIKLTILGIASVLVAIAVIEVGRSTAVLVYISATIIGVLFLPDKSVVAGYAVLMGYYPILKHMIEQHRVLLLEFLIKLIVFNMALLSSGFLVTRFIVVDIDIPIPLVLIWILAQLVFIIYDIALTVVIAYYVNRIRNRLFRRP